MALASSVRSTCQSGLCPSCCHKALPLLGCFVAKCLSGSSPGPALCPAAPPPPPGPEFLSSIEASGRDWLSQEGQAGFLWNWATRGGDWGGLGVSEWRGLPGRGPIPSCSARGNLPDLAAASDALDRFFLEAGFPAAVSPTSPGFPCLSGQPSSVFSAGSSSEIPLTGGSITVTAQHSTPVLSTPHSPSLVFTSLPSARLSSSCACEIQLRLALCIISDGTYPRGHA